MQGLRDENHWDCGKDQQATTMPVPLRAQESKVGIKEIQIESQKKIEIEIEQKGCLMDVDKEQRESKTRRIDSRALTRRNRVTPAVVHCKEGTAMCRTLAHWANYKNTSQDKAPHTGACTYLTFMPSESYYPHTNNSQVSVSVSVSASPYRERQNLSASVTSWIPVL